LIFGPWPLVRRQGFVAVTHKNYQNTVDMIQFVNDMRNKHS
jgi:hypothetical protein